VNQGERAGQGRAFTRGGTGNWRVLSYPDYDRRLWNHTRSADLWL